MFKSLKNGRQAYASENSTHFAQNMKFHMVRSTSHYLEAISCIALATFCDTDNKEVLCQTNEFPICFNTSLMTQKLSVLLIAFPHDLALNTCLSLVTRVSCRINRYTSRLCKKNQELF